MSAVWDVMTRAARMRPTTMTARQTAQIMTTIITALWTAPKHSIIILRTIIRAQTRLNHQRFLQLPLSAVWDVMTRAARMRPTTMTVRQTAQIMTTITTVI
ncbi:MAG: hypothetical protein K2H41_06500 [Acetatifactor sp.]|nr:hypothetical protein [Acetatifactor sp.]